MKRLFACMVLIACSGCQRPVDAQQVDVIGSADEAIAWLEAADWWGPLPDGGPLALCASRTKAGPL